MNPTISVDTTNFQLAFQRYASTTRRSVPKIVNARMFFVLVRAYLILPPKSPVAARQKIRQSLTQMIKTRKAPSREVMKLYAIVNSGRGSLTTTTSNRTGKQLTLKGNKGLYGKKMEIAARKVMSRALGGVGYLRALVVKAIRGFQGFRQFGTKKISTGKYGNANRAAVALSAKYQSQQQSVAVYRRSSNRPFTKKASEGIRPNAVAVLSGNEVEKIGASGAGILRNALNAALNDEAEELRNHLLAKFGEDAIVGLTPLGITVKQ